MNISRAIAKVSRNTRQQNGRTINQWYYYLILLARSTTIVVSWISAHVCLKFTGDKTEMGTYMEKSFVWHLMYIHTKHRIINWGVAWCLHGNGHQCNNDGDLLKAAISRPETSWHDTHRFNNALKPFPSLQLPHKIPVWNWKWRL